MVSIPRFHASRRVHRGVVAVAVAMRFAEWTEHDPLKHPE